jgi:DNA modification methylase
MKNSKPTPTQKSLSATPLKARLEESSDLRLAMIKKYGFIPRSILAGVSRGKLSSSLFILQREDPTRNESTQKGVIEKSARLKKYGFKSNASQKGAGRGKPGASIMPAELVKFFIDYYAEEGQCYIDPFMGQGVQLQVAGMCGLRYIGYDLSEEFFRYIAQVQIKTCARYGCRAEAYLGDSRNPDMIKDGVGDFCFTSPPYWDIEDYGDDPRQLGKNTYQGFLEGLEQVFTAWKPKFKSGAWVILNTNDFRKLGRFYPYHADCIRLMQSAGYTIYDTWIIDGLVGVMPKAFSVDFNLKHIAPKIHEYALVFKA